MKKDKSHVLDLVGKGHFHSLTAEQKVVFYEEILSQVQAMIYINQIDDLKDNTTAKNVWSTPYGYELLGYTRNEVEKMGHLLWKKTMHPDDQEVPWDSLAEMYKKQGDTFWGVYRNVTHDGETVWLYGNSRLLHMKNDLPWQFLNIAVKLGDALGTRQQLVELIQENSRLQNQLMLLGITPREKEIVCLIAKGLTDKEIAISLNISVQTAKKHRSNLLKKLNKRNTAELVSFAEHNGLT